MSEVFRTTQCGGRAARPSFVTRELSSAWRFKSSLFHKEVISRFTEIFWVRSQEDTDISYGGEDKRKSKDKITVSQRNCFERVENLVMNEYKRS